MMKDLLREQLIRIVQEYGADILKDPKKVNGLLKDFCPEEPRGKIFAITQCLREGIAKELIDSSKRKTIRIDMSRLIRKIHDNFGLKEYISRWAVETVALALGIIDQDKPVDTVEKKEDKALEKKPLDLSELQVTRKEETKDEKKESVPTSVYSTSTSTRKTGKKRRTGPWLFGIFVFVALVIVFILISRNKSPIIPFNPSPSDKATNQSLAGTLSWECSDPDGDSLTYDVYFGTSSNPPKVSTNQSGKTLNRSNLSAGTTYYWKVVAKDSRGAITEESVWSFTTQSAPTASSYTPSSIVPQMILVEKGSFTMGDTWGDGSNDERPVRLVELTYDFYIGKYETTFDEYDAFCEATGKSSPDDENWGRGRRPVINVSWNDATAYCNWLSEKEKLPKAYDGNGNLLDKDGRITTDPSKVVGYRLPTEAEWEYAARGGNKSKGYKYSGSDNADDVAWYASNSKSMTLETGSKLPNELGIYDMSGNVWEWCSDWYGSYSGSAQTNFYNSTGSSYRVNRGGSWYSSAAYARVAFRGSYSASSTRGNLGFRIARTVP